MRVCELRLALEFSRETQDIPRLKVSGSDDGGGNAVHFTALTCFELKPLR